MGRLSWFEGENAERNTDEALSHVGGAGLQAQAPGSVFSCWNDGGGNEPNFGEGKMRPRCTRIENRGRRKVTL